MIAPFVSLGPPGFIRAAGRSLGGGRIESSGAGLNQWPVGRLELAVIHDKVVWDTGEIVVLPEGARIGARRIDARRTAINVVRLGPDVTVEGPEEVERTPIEGGVCITVEWPGLPEPAVMVRTRLERDEQPLRHRVRVPFGPGAVERNGALLAGADTNPFC